MSTSKLREKSILNDLSQTMQRPNGLKAKQQEFLSKGRQNIITLHLSLMYSMYSMSEICFLTEVVNFSEGYKIL